MICPHCLKTVEDDASFCPYCHGYVGPGKTASTSDFVFCEGCGARLTSHDRLCPKCGRPAPGILSTESSSSDLAAGKTASFPRLTQSMIDAEIPELRQRDALSASRVAVESVDPFATNVLRLSDIEEAERAAKKPHGVPAPAPAVPDPVTGEDPYHKPRRRWVRPLVITAALLAVVGGAGFFVACDPMGVMPGLRASLEEQASQMFPSRQLPSGSAAVDAQAAAAQEAERAKEDTGPLTDAQAYQRLSAAYKSIAGVHDDLGTIIDDYNAGWMATSMDMRKECSASAYAARDTIDKVVEELQDLKLQEGSAYADDVQNLVQLAGWVRERVDMYCESWDISLAIIDDYPSEHQSEILAPLRERSQSDLAARTEFYAHVDAYEPQPVS